MLLNILCFFARNAFTLKPIIKTEESVILFNKILQHRMSLFLILETFYYITSKIIIIDVLFDEPLYF